MTTFINISRLLRSCSTLRTTKHISVRYSGFINSPFLEDVQIKAKYEVTKSPSEWKYVVRILPPLTVPELALRDKYNSTFKPQGDVKDRPYIVCRTKNHMIPVYLKISQRGVKRLTYVRKIQGDIWLLGKELETYLQPMSKRPLRMQVNEFTGSIIINGDYVNAIKYWLTERDY
ncbi:hypothetical protein WA026_006087 [Henosepilachna vigintioctopunctata]|uniref:Large ribosomal subunit protein mL49 n=1 Tax=Henosepilachna vigintioctopunctata TaxID=420089 RepID=A0AAW1TNL4_9CUCU